MPQKGPVRVVRRMATWVAPGGTLDVTLEVTHLEEGGPPVVVVLTEHPSPRLTAGGDLPVQRVVHVAPGATEHVTYKLTASHEEGPARVSGRLGIEAASGAFVLDHYTLVGVYPRILVEQPDDTAKFAGRLVDFNRFDRRVGQIFLGDPLYFLSAYCAIDYTKVAGRWIQQEFAFAAHGVPVPAEQRAGLEDGSLTIAHLDELILEIDDGADDPCEQSHPKPAAPRVPEYEIEVKR